MEFKVHGGRKEIILPGGAEIEPKAQQNRPLVLARAYRWQRMIDASEVPGIEAIAARCGVDRTHISRLLQLTSLAPDIIQTILAGDEPSGLSLTNLRNGVPKRWDEHRQMCRQN
jgi:hypothetical protein